MQISEVRIKLVDNSRDRLLAFCSITIDEAFVVRDLKIIEGTRGPFVAMPSRKLMDRCRHCGGKNALRAPYCNDCGGRLRDDRAPKSEDGRAKLYADIAHPINTDCREMIQDAVLTAFEDEKIAADQPGYICRYDDFGENDPTGEDYDDPDFTPRSISQKPGRQTVSTDEGQTRIEPAAGQSPPKPHADTRSRDRESISTHNKDEEDASFGAGID